MTNTRVLLIHWWYDYFYEVFIPFVSGCPKLKPSRVSNTSAPRVVNCSATQAHRPPKFVTCSKTHQGIAIFAFK